VCTSLKGRTPWRLRLRAAEAARRIRGRVRRGFAPPLGPAAPCPGGAWSSGSRREARRGRRRPRPDLRQGGSRAGGARRRCSGTARALAGPETRGGAGWEGLRAPRREPPADPHRVPTPHAAFDTARDSQAACRRPGRAGQGGARPAQPFEPRLRRRSPAAGSMRPSAAACCWRGFRVRRGRRRGGRRRARAGEKTEERKERTLGFEPRALRGRGRRGCGRGRWGSAGWALRRMIHRRWTVGCS